jgi:hypothetical protein
MTRADFARYMGVHKSQVTRWVAAGMPTRKDGSVDPEPARTWVKKNIDPTRRALVRRHVTPSRREKVPPAPAGCAHLAGNIVDTALVAALPALAYRVPRLAAVAAVASGAPRETAEAVYRIVAVGVMQEVADLLTALDVPCPPGVSDWFGADMWDPQGFTQPDWETVAGAAAGAHS